MGRLSFYHLKGFQGATKIQKQNILTSNWFRSLLFHFTEESTLWVISFRLAFSGRDFLYPNRLMLWILVLNGSRVCQHRLLLVLHDRLHEPSHQNRRNCSTTIVAMLRGPHGQPEINVNQSAEDQKKGEITRLLCEDLMSFPCQIFLYKPPFLSFLSLSPSLFVVLNHKRPIIELVPIRKSLSSLKKTRFFRFQR